MTIMAITRRHSSLKSAPNLQAINEQHNGSGIASGVESNNNAHVQKRRRSRWFSWSSSLSSTPLKPSISSPVASSSSTQSRHRHRLSHRVLDRLQSYTKNNSTVHVTICGALTFISLAYILHFLIILEFGTQGSIKGGGIGILYDQIAKDRIRYRTIVKWREQVKSILNIPIVYRYRSGGDDEGTLLEPWYFPLDAIIKTRPNSAVIEMLLREKRRLEVINTMIQYAEYLESCAKEDSSSSLLVDIPTTVLQLLPHNEQPTLLPYWIVRSEVMNIDYISINTLDINIDIAQSIIKRCQEWGLGDDSELQCLAYHIGGMQLSSNYLALEQSRPFIKAILSFVGTTSETAAQSQHNQGGGTCKSKLGYAVFSNTPTPVDQLRKKSAISSHVSTIFTALPPNHPIYVCIPPYETPGIGISPYNEANIELSSQSTLINKLITEIESRNINNTNHSVWGLATLECDLANDTKSKGAIYNCCNTNQVSVTILNSLDQADIAKHVKNANPNHHHLIYTSSRLSSNDKERSPSQQSNKVSVTISESSNSSEKQQQRRHKESIQMKLRNIWNCEPGWWCNRCLVQGGSFSSCASTCSDCAATSICNTDEFDEDTTTRQRQVNINVQVTTNFHNTQQQQQQQRIPRIIHQTYFERITMEKYPQLYRLQNTWKASGWQHRFYDDMAAREYITSNYPPRFLSVFDTLLPGAYKADFFRYLVLFKEGGIYVDVDVMLNTNLDTFITPDLAFFAPLDAVGTFADEQYCMWNGLLGSAPGHPVMANVIEWIVNVVSNRGDMYDLERGVCSFSGVNKIENWKIRSEPGLMLSGPCALGLAVNNALGNKPLSKFKPGLLREEGYNTKGIEDLNSDDIGNVMILAVSYHACRCTSWTI